MFDRRRGDGDVQGLRDRIIARYNAKTGSDASATHGPLIEALLEELLAPEPEPSLGREEVQS